MWSILKYLREDPEILIQSQKRRNESTEIIKVAISLDKEWRRQLTELNKLRHKRNLLSEKMKSKKDNSLIKKAKELSKLIKKKEGDIKKLENELKKVLLSIPNVVHESVPIGENEEDNVPIRYWGKPKVYKGYLDSFLEATKGLVEYEVIEKLPIAHADLVAEYGLADIERAAKVSGSRFFYLLSDLVWLDFALMQFALDFLVKRGFKIVCPPYMMRRKAYEGVTALSDFEEMIYKVEDEDLYLIATSEHPLAAMHMNEVIEEKELPILYAGISPCFRKEAGAHGKDTKGIFRVHQFHKVEQFVFCHPNESWKWHEKLITHAEEIWKALKIPYRIVNICTGDLGIVAAKKYDLEAWMPAQGKYREMVSCSNCTDWQSYRLNIRFAEEKGKPTKGFVHTLNSTAIATTRAITAILENFQEEDGIIKIPKVLKRYLEPIDSAPKDYIKINIKD